MSKFADIFYDTSKPTERKLLKVCVEDFELLNKVFPETGISTNVTTYMFAVLAEKLRQRGVVDYESREKEGFTIANLKELLK